MSRIIFMTSKQIIIDEGSGYKLRASLEKVGSFLVIAIDWEHPNYGVFADAMLWCRSPHMFEWGVVSVVNWTHHYTENSKPLEEFLKDYPEFSMLFRGTHLNMD